MLSGFCAGGGGGDLEAKGQLSITAWEKMALKLRHQSRHQAPTGLVTFKSNAGESFERKDGVHAHYLGLSVYI